MLDSLDNGRDEKDKAVNSQKQLRSDKFNSGSCIQDEESCQKGDMCPRNGGSLQGINLKFGKSYLKMMSDEKVESDLLVNVKSTERTNCLDGECCTESPQTARMTGSSCRALKHAVSTLNRLDDFNMEKIGSGFFSEVFKVTHKVTGKVMVLKMNLLRSNRPNMLKEVQLMNQLKHQNILKFKGVCVHEGQLHALTEYINGGSLEQLIQARNIDWPYLTRQKLALDIARGMEYLHGKGVFHRDLTSKNVLIKKSDDGSMTAVVGDFGLAAKIPDPKCKYRLPTVGSAYWMSPECLKGHWYNEKSDIFSFGIVLCEMIARIEADPDILPRTDNFGLDYLAFSELCGPCPPHFLKLAFSCCTFEPKSRPSFSEIVKTLERLIPEYQELLSKEAEEEIKIVNAGSLNNLIDVNDKSNMAARSEEVINKCATSGRDMIQQRKQHHRRSLSEDVANVVFPKHTAPSDKARCHFMTTSKQQSCEVLANPKHIGESMCQVDPHYKPRLSGEKGGRSNPFLSLAQFRGVKKIVGSQNIQLSKDTHNSIESPTSFLQNNDLFSSCFELPSPFYGITPPSSPVTGNSFDEKTKKNVCCGCYQDGCDFKDDCGKSCRMDESEGECKKAARRLFPVETSPEANKNKQYFDISSSSPKSNVCCHHQKISCVNDHSKSLLLSSSSSSSSSQSPNIILRSVNKKSVLKRDEFPHRHQNFPPNRNLSLSLPSSPTLQRKASRESAIFAQKETEKQLVIPSDDESNEIPKKLIKSKTVPLIKKNAEFPGAKKSESKTNKDLKKTDRDQHEDESSSSSSKNLPDNLIFQENLPNTKDVRKKNDKKTTNETDLNTLVTNRISTSSSNLLECTADDGFLLASNMQLKRRGSCESGFFSCVGEDYGITGNEILPCEYILQSTRQKHLDNSSATLSSSSATSSLFLLDDSLSTTTVSSLRSGSGDFNDLDDLPSRFTHHSILFSTKRPSSIYTDSSEDISSLGDLDERNHSRYQSQQISKIVEYFERKQTGVTRNETYTKYKRNFNIEFQRNIERFDTSRADDNNKIKWEGLEGKFKKSGMGLTQKLRDNNCDDGPRSKVLYDVNNFRLKKFGPQNAAENSYHHDLSKKFEGSCSISDAIRKSKIELLRKSLERGTLQVPGINPHLSSNSGVSGTRSDRNSTRPLATRLLICEGAVKSKLPLFDKK